MNIETIEHYFNLEGIESVFTTPDNKIHLSYDNALSHCEIHHLDEKEILEWFEEYSGSDPIPKIRSVECQTGTQIKAGPTKIFPIIDEIQTLL